MYNVDKGLKVIENELVPVYETDKGIKIVYGKDLHKVLEVKTDFSTWVKRRLSDCDAKQKTDYDLLPQIEGQVSGAKHSIEYIINLDTAKEMAMLERNEKGKEVRRYFIRVEEKYKLQILDKSQLSPQMQLMNMLVENMSRQELEQKRQVEELAVLKENQKAINTAMLGQREENFKSWANRCLSAIAESPSYPYIGSREERHRAVRAESYERLNQKKPCRLNQRVESEKGRASIAGASAARIKGITKLSVIESDKALKPLYEAVIREMMIAYCVEVA